MTHATAPMRSERCICKQMHGRVRNRNLIYPIAISLLCAALRTLYMTLHQLLPLDAALEWSLAEPADMASTRARDRK